MSVPGPTQELWKYQPLLDEYFCRETVLLHQGQPRACLGGSFPRNNLIFVLLRPAVDPTLLSSAPVSSLWGSIGSRHTLGFVTR